jgi:hypothetical protein
MDQSIEIGESMVFRGHVTLMLFDWNWQLQHPIKLMGLFQFRPEVFPVFYPLFEVAVFFV